MVVISIIIHSQLWFLWSTIIFMIVYLDRFFLDYHCDWTAELFVGHHCNWTWSFASIIVIELDPLWASSWFDWLIILKHRREWSSWLFVHATLSQLNLSIVCSSDIVAIELDHIWWSWLFVNDWSYCLFKHSHAIKLLEPSRVQLAFSPGILVGGGQRWREGPNSERLL